MRISGDSRDNRRQSSTRRRFAVATLVAGAVATTALSAATTTAAAQPAIPADFAAISSQLATIAPYNATIAAPSVVRPAHGTFTSGFGPRWGTMHNGIDIANAIGTPIYSVMSGTVINSGPASGYGQWIRVRHDDGSMAVYGHMSALYVSVGERVSAGQTIAGMGSEGFSTGSHLHFEIHPAGMGPVDPVGWFANHGIYF